MLHSTLIRLGAATGATIALLIGSATAVLAEPVPVTVLGRAIAEEHFTQRVDFADLDLSASSGRRQLLRRVGSAAHRVCAPGAFATLLTAGEYSGCVDGALIEARPQVDRAVARARQLASVGRSALPAMAISVSAAI